MSLPSDKLASEIEADQDRLRNAKLGALLNEIERRDLSFAAWNTHGVLVRSHNARRADGEQVFRVDLPSIDNKEIFAELNTRDILVSAWDSEGHLIAGREPHCCYCDDGQDIAVASRSDLDEATDRLRRGDLFEALIHLERAIPALEGLHDAVRKLQR